MLLRLAFLSNRALTVSDGNDEVASVTSYPDIQRRLGHVPPCTLLIIVNEFKLTAAICSTRYMVFFLKNYMGFINRKCSLIQVTPE